MFKIWLYSILLIITFYSIKAQTAAGSCTTLNVSAAINSVLTPFKTNGELNLEIIPEYAKYLADNGIPDILVPGYIGEAGSMNACDRIALIRTWVEAAECHGIGVLVQIAGGIPFNDILSIVEVCVELNVKALVVLPLTIYEPQTVEEYILDLQVIADIAVGIPIILEETSALQFPVNIVEVCIEVSDQIPCVTGVITNLNTALGLVASLPGIIASGKVIIITSHESISVARQQEFTTVNAVSNFFPTLVLDIIAAIDSEDYDLADILQAELNLKVAAALDLDADIRLKARSRAFIVNHKVTLELITGLKISIPRLPLLPAAVELVEQIASALEDLGVTLLGSVEGVREPV